MTISFNPQLTTSPQSSFQVDTKGFVQGAFFDDPTTRLQLASGKIASTVTQPVWGGMTVSEGVNAPNTNQGGNPLTLAANYAGVTAFTVFNQANNMIIVPGNTVQQAVAGMDISYFRLGSNARIAVQCSAALANALSAGLTNQKVSWDFVNQILIPFSVTALPVKVLEVNTNSQIVNYNAGTGALTYAIGACALIQI